MDNQQQSPFVTIYCDIVNNSDTDGDSDKTIELSSNAQRSPSPPQLSPLPESFLQPPPSPIPQATLKKKTILYVAIFSHLTRHGISKNQHARIKYKMKFHPLCRYIEVISQSTLYTPLAKVYVHFSKSRNPCLYLQAKKTN